MNPDSRAEHQWLQRLVGEWVFEPEPVGPDGKVGGMSGSESVRMLGEAWALCEMQVGAGGEDGGSNLMTLGFDPEKECFVGTFVSSMMAHLWIYQGELDESGTSLLLDTEGPSFTSEGETSRYRDRIELVHQDERVLSSSVLDPDGQWREFMRTRYRRNPLR